jgi:hypothetical protein
MPLSAIALLLDSRLAPALLTGPRLSAKARFPAVVGLLMNWRPAASAPVAAVVSGLEFSAVKLAHAVSAPLIEALLLVEPPFVAIELWPNSM